MTSWTIWFTGMHGAGKSTIASKLAGHLIREKIPFVIIDGDEARKFVSSDLGYSIEDRNEHMKRVAGICRIISENGILAIASVSSPTKKSRDYARKTLKKIFLVYVKCPAEVCRKRDVKGHYKKAGLVKKGFENFLGVSLKYEEPKNPDVILKTDKETVQESLNKLAKALKAKKALR